MIEVILLERIERLGQLGQVVKVRPGFARNFLLPKNKALRATKSNLDLFEKQRATYEKKNADERSKAETLAGKMDGLKLTVIRQASESGQLYGSVNARDIADAALASNQNFDKTQVQIDAPIKVLGLFPIKVKLHPEVLIKITLNIARSQEEALMQAEKGAAVSKAAAEKAEVEAAFGVPDAAKETEVADAEKPAKKAKKAKGDDAAVADEASAEPKAKKARAKKSSEG